MSTKKLNPRLYRGDSTFTALDLEGEMKKADDLKKRRTQRRQSFSNIEGIAMAAKKQQIKERANAPVTILAPLKRVPKTYRIGSRKTSQGDRGSRSRSNSSMPSSEELITDTSTATTENNFETPNVETSEELEQKSFLPSLVKDSSNRRKNPLQTLNPSMMKREAPQNVKGGRKKTMKRRRAKKSCGFFW